MKRISATNVLSSGLLAGLALLAGEYVFNVLLLGRDVASATQPFAHLLGRLTAPLLMLNTLVLGVVLVWVYAAFKAQFGAGLKTILRAALVVWFLAWFHCAVVASALGVSSPGYFWLSAVWGVVEAPAAALAGAWLYRRIEQRAENQ